jgi:plasmid stabilization system protein ParE
MKIRYTRRARRDIEGIFDYIAKENLDAALRMRGAIWYAIELIATHPYIGIKNAREPRLRSRLVSRYPYRVHYMLHEGEVWIIHIRHTARRPWQVER